MESKEACASSDRSQPSKWRSWDVNEHLAHESLEQRDIRENAVTLCHLAQHERVDVLEAIETLKGVAPLKGCRHVLHPTTLVTI
jgi:hypothetical protein